MKIAYRKNRKFLLKNRVLLDVFIRPSSGPHTEWAIEYSRATGIEYEFKKVACGNSLREVMGRLRLGIAKATNLKIKKVHNRVAPLSLSHWAEMNTVSASKVLPWCASVQNRKVGPVVWPKWKKVK